MRLLSTLAVAIGLAFPASAQILTVHFKDAKAAAKYRKQTVEVAGEAVLVGEAKYGVSFEDSKVTWLSSGTLEFYLGDPQDPSHVPYKFQGDQRVPTSPKGVADVTATHVARIGVLMREENLYGLAQEYRERLARIDELTRERDAQPKASREWFLVHHRLISRYESLQTWLASTLYPDAAKKLQKEIDRQSKTVAAEALELRASKGKEAIRQVPTPPELVEASQAISGGKHVFAVQESEHLRIVHLDTVPAERVRELLEFGEDIIEGFRREFVDPYLGPDFEDFVPDRLFAEWWFGPTEISAHDRYYTQYYRLAWDEHKQDRLESDATGTQRPLPPESLYYCKLIEDADLEGWMAHQLGHELARIHFDRNRIGMRMDWLREGVGYYLALEYLGRNNVTCKGLEREARYVHEKKKEGEKTARLGLRDFYNSLALDEGRPIDILAIRDLYGMDDADLAKSWSFFDFIAHKEGKAGQLFLRAMCQAAREKASFVKDWRAKAEEIYDVQGEDVFKLIDERWRKFAEAGQETGDAKRAR
ncbi:MAG TPA: hypothetical protein VMS76_16200 [Planctomycetota bacterium]|nr:hypothetical protein [Planctomycetota bacterium]